MKLEIDLNEILGDEYYQETVEDSVRRQVVEKLKEDLHKRIGKKIDDEINKKIEVLMSEQLEARFPKMIDELWEMSYTPVGKYGQKSEETTLKNELLKSISEQLVYKKTNYSSDRNVFTTSVDKSVENAMQGFKKEFDDTVTRELKHEALQYALKRLQLKEMK